MTLHVAPVIYIGGTQPANQVECQVTSASLHHGRDDATTQPEASTLTLEFVGDLPAAAVMGARVELAAKLVAGGGQYTRFVGEITDIGIGWADVDSVRPQVIATGTLARSGRRMIGDTPWPEELDGDRVNRILTLAGFPPTAGQSDPGTVAILARDVDRQPALDLARETATDGGGIVWQSKFGQQLYADALHRHGAQVAFEFAACDLSVGLAWLDSPEGLVNEVYVRYGTPPTGGLQAEVHAIDTASVGARGTYAESLSTNIANQADAQRRANEIIARQADPTWVVAGIEVALDRLDLAQTKALMALELHNLVSVTGLPDGSPATSALVWVEGWRETIEPVGPGPGQLAWVIGYATSDYCRTAAPPMWDDMRPDVTWDTADPGLTWDGAVCIPPQPSAGRWADVPASLRWDDVWPNTITWDTWPH